MACDCSASRRSPSGSSWLRKSSAPVQISRLMVAPVNRKKSRSVSMRSSYPDVGDPADDEDAHDLRNNGVGEKLAAGGVGPQRPDVVGIEDVAAQPHHDGQHAQQAGGKALLRGVCFELSRSE